MTMLRRCPSFSQNSSVAYVAFAGEYLRALCQVKDANLVLGDQVLGKGKIPLHLRQVGQGQQGPCT